MSAVIDKTTAQSLISAYQSQNSGTNGPALLTPDGQFLNGFFIDRRSLDAILSDKNTIGISVHFAKHPDFPTSTDNKITLILTGAEINPAYPDDPAAAPYIGKYENWDLFGPCPPFCTELV